MAENAQRVRDIIVKELGVEREKLTDDASFIEDLGADSLDIVELVMEFEKEFNIDIQYGDADIVISGGSEATVTPMAIGGFANMKALSERNDSPETASRPFDSTRDGFVMGEGAGVVILEELEHARRRGARIYAEVVGYGATADAYHLTAPAPEGEGAQRAMRRAMKDAGWGPGDVDYINAHGTSTPANDLNETKA